MKIGQFRLPAVEGRFNTVRNKQMWIRYIRYGYCNNCGDCCRPEFRAARIAFYHASGIGYKLIRGEAGCPDFNPETGKCRDYAHRPRECVRFPRLPIDVIALPHCSYYFLPEITET